METSELLRNITALPVISTGLAEEMMAGNFSSVFKGQGMEFDEARHYEPGDDIRSIDWNASARFGTPFVKMFREEREITILIILDISPSMRRGDFALNNISPYEQGLISAASIAFSAEHTGQQVGAFFFDRDIERVFPPRKGRRHIMALVMAALQYQKERKTRGDRHGSNIACALTGAQRLLKRRSFIVLISDFYSIGWEQEMTNLCRKHDCFAIRICDPPDLPYPGLITLEDPETGVRIEAPVGLTSFQESWLQWHKERSIRWASLCRHSGAAFLELPTTTDAPASLLKFFGNYSRSQYKSRKYR
ncbi:MAG: DUF58 domain-containing protein [Treponema sp.]|nr:DUF58 domain-containing protein [Treponema sp.]